MYKYIYPIIRYNIIYTVICVQSDASYLLEYQARSRYGEGRGLGAQSFNQNDNNGAILTISQIIKNVMAPASEEECEALFMNPREAILVRNTLEEIGHTQPTTKMQVENST